MIEKLQFWQNLAIVCVFIGGFVTIAANLASTLLSNKISKLKSEAQAQDANTKHDKVISVIDTSKDEILTEFKQEKTDAIANELPELSITPKFERSSSSNGEVRFRILILVSNNSDFPAKNISVRLYSKEFSPDRKYKSNIDFLFKTIDYVKQGTKIWHTQTYTIYKKHKLPVDSIKYRSSEAFTEPHGLLFTMVYYNKYGKKFEHEYPID